MKATRGNRSITQEVDLMKTETMNQKIIPFAVGIVWTCAVCVAIR
jgi:hypothetical protein